MLVGGAVLPKVGVVRQAGAIKRKFSWEGSLTTPRMQSVLAKKKSSMVPNMMFKLLAVTQEDEVCGKAVARVPHLHCREIL